MASLDETMKGTAPERPDPTGDALLEFRPGGVESARRVVEAAGAQYGKVPDVLVAILMDPVMMPKRWQRFAVMRMIDRVGWSGGPIE